MGKLIEINGRKIGPDEPPYVICELSGNHNGDLKKALELVDAAADTGCDAIKIQTYTPDSMTINCKSDDFIINSGLWKGYNLYDLYIEAHTPMEWHEALFARARERGVTIFSTPFDEVAADFLDELGVPAFKVASFEANDINLIAHIAKKRKPMIISTGLADLSEISRAVSVAKENGCEDIILLHCISSYPAPTNESNVRTVENLANTFDLVVGLSDHTMDNASAIASIALGGSVIEKHFIISRSDGGPDSAFSLEPDEFSALCTDCRNAWEALGKVSYDLKPAERANIKFRRSLYAVADIKKGETFTKKNVRSIRPGFGLAPEHQGLILGKKANADIAFGTPMSFDLIG